ncbi:MAG: sensor histidine kinase [Acidobacteriota bacterium]|nr:sensor histidine kinase [Acidobacteriota bacterium]
MPTASTEDDHLARIPSPSLRLWAGLCVILSIFVVFAVYSIRQIRWLEDFQMNVVQRNRRASIVLLRLQDDNHQLGLLLRDMMLKQEYPLVDLRATFSRLHGDMSNALVLDSQYAVRTKATEDKAAELRRDLGVFWQGVDKAFGLARQGDETGARNLIQNSLLGENAVLVGAVADLLRLNDEAQTEAAQRIATVYRNFKRDNFVLLGILLLLAVVTGLFTFQANRKTFERLGHLAQRLQAQSEQLRKLSWKLIDVQEETLRQVARDLHDEFGQILTAIGIMLARAGQTSDPAQASTLSGIREVKNVVEETLQNIRDRSQMFRPAILDDFGLAKTLEWFAEQFSRQTDIAVHIEGDLSQISFPGGDAIHIYRIVQEALSNVARHSGASEAWVTIAQDGEFLRVEIRDRGHGFDASKDMDQRSGEGFGLMGMHERAQRLNGALQVRSAPGKGAVVSVRIPLGRAGSTGNEHHAEQKVRA